MIKFLGCSAHQNWLHLSWDCYKKSDIKKVIRAFRKKHGDSLFQTHELHEWVGNIPIKTYWMVSTSLPIQYLNKYFK
jgi:hypothetical protein